MTDDYDISLDAYLSYLEAIKELRRRLVEKRESGLTKSHHPP
jgi:hypothetical protein